MFDDGHFGADSVSWRVHREVTVLFGGARAVLLHAAHPLVIAGANQTAMYERDPWRRLQRTLVLQYALTFGTRAEALSAAERINAIHERINGVDHVTGRRYDALDSDLLLWVHACLVDSALLFERLTVGALGFADRQRFHEEQMLAAEMLRLPREAIPPTVAELEAYVERTAATDLLVTDAARSVAGLFLEPPRDAQWRPVLRLVARLAFATLPDRVREAYGVGQGSVRAVSTRGAFAAIRRLRPLLPPAIRYIAPYRRWHGARPERLDELRRSLGIRR